MRLLYLQQLLVLPDCPGNNRCWQFAQQWRAAGHEVTFVASDAQLPANHLLKVREGKMLHTEYEGIELYLLPVRYDHLMGSRQRVGAFLQFFQQARRLLRRLDLGVFDAVLAYSAPLSVGELGRQTAAKLDKPFFFEVADVWPDTPIQMGMLPGRRLSHWLLHRTDRIYEQARQIFPFSEGMAELIMDHDVPEERITVVPNGADVEAIRFVPRPADKVGPIELIYTGTIGRANDLSQFMRAMGEIERQGREDIRLTVVGQGNDLARIEHLAQELQLHQVCFRPQVSREEATDLLDGADIGLVSFAPFPVLETNSATKFFDYLAAGLPIITNYQGWQARYLTEFRCGFSAPQGNDMALTQNILFLASSAQMRAQFSRAGRKLAEMHFDRRKLAQQMMARMLELL